MPSSILSSLVSKPALSIVSNQTGVEYGSNLSTEKVLLRFRSVTQKHKKETGTSIVDARIILPIVIEITAFCGTLDQLEMINALLLDRESGYAITSKGVVIQNMMADENTIRQTPDCISANPIVLTFEQVLVQGGSPAPNVAQSADSSLIDRGIQTVQSVTGLGTLTNTITAAASSVKAYVSGALTDGTGSSFIMDSSELS